MKRIIFSIFIALIAFGGFAQVKVSILGDSYSTFKGWNPEGQDIWYAPGRGNDVQDVKDTWWYDLITNNGLELELNNSWSGATICNTGHNGADYSDRSYINRATLLGDNPDIIYVFGGTNDAWVNAPLGSLDSNNPYEVIPATRGMLQNIKNKYPEALCIVIINTELSKEVENALVEISELENVPYVKLQAIDKQKGHPSINGMKQISNQVWKTTAPLLYNQLKKK